MENSGLIQTLYRKGVPLDLFLVPVVCLLDRKSKLWSKLNTVEFGPLAFEVNYNHGAIFGSLSDLYPSVKLMLFTILGVLTVCTYVLARFFLPSRSLFLKFGPTLLVSGIIGNLLDRFLENARVIDFISVLGSPAFNLADLSQLLGHMFILFGLTKDLRSYWPPGDKRRSFWVDPEFQIRYCSQILALTSCASLGIGIVSTVFFKIALDNLRVPSELQSQLLGTLFWILLSVFGIIVIGVFLFSRYLSQRIAGPKIAMKRFLRDALTSNTYEFKLRGNDEFKEFEPILSEVAKRVAKN